MTIERFINNFENIEKIKKKTLLVLKDFRYNYTEEIPDEILTPDMENYHLYKCRTNFFNNISVKILLIRELKIKLSQEGEKRCDDFLDYCETIQGTDRRYTQDDIDKANEILDVLIKELSLKT